MDKIKLLSQAQISKFTSLVKKDTQSKLNAEEVTHLNPSIYRQYLKKIKYFAGSKNLNHRSTRKEAPQHPHYRFNHIKTIQKIHSKLKSPSKSNLSSPNKNQEANRISSTISSSPSFYYANQNEILSLKQFVILLQESKKRQQREERLQYRKKQKEFIDYVGRSIQSSHSQRNLRLTSSSANRIIKHINKIHNQRIYQ